MGARRGQRAVVQQRQSRLQSRAVQRGPRLYRAGLDEARTVALRGQAFPLSPRQSMGAAVSKTASADVDSGRDQPRDREVVRGTSLPLYRAGDDARADLRSLGLLC